MTPSISNHQSAGQDSEPEDSLDQLSKSTQKQVSSKRRASDDGERPEAEHHAGAASSRKSSASSESDGKKSHKKKKGKSTEPADGEEVADSKEPGSESSEKDVEAEELAEFEVEKITSKREVNGVTEYKVKWVGYSSKDSTWEPVTNIVACDEKVQEFEAEYAERRKTKRVIAPSLSEAVLAKKFTPVVEKSRSNKPKSAKTEGKKETTVNGESVQKKEGDTVSKKSFVTTSTSAPKKKSKTTGTVDAVLAKPSTPSTSQSQIMLLKPPPNMSSAIKSLERIGSPLKQPSDLVVPKAPRVRKIQTVKKGPVLPVASHGPVLYLNGLTPAQKVPVATKGTSMDMDTIEDSVALSDDERLEIKELLAVANKAQKCVGLCPREKGSGAVLYAMISFEGNWSKMFSLNVVKKVLPMTVLDYYEGCLTLRPDTASQISK